ncbi:MAG: CusA/CzcA family heavy metal efflux RND transporter [Aquabacterium sp.]|jgi:cobalt-zinc-cadmium resistance protein CzcA|uniref:efflux RND transporter permease subunit n=1 Tax=Aquabacterium sp. TaxID=1872578 RepID=UPI002A36A50B|nr:CusA/CzcA family heavy metal efflux RND transporter [Aquabacterium sp.]MDX9845254.1 CusA/CzcA family heavy metal efflux RND transporter [Aquabacterium sp.]
MLAKLIEFSLRQRVLVMLLVVMLGGAGVAAWMGLPIDAFPDVSSTQVKLILKAPGMTPEEVETRITIPIEQEVLGIPKQKSLRSTSKYGLADITLDFEDGTDVYWARQQVSERLAGVMADLPPTASGGLAPITTPLGEMYMFTIEGPQTLEERRRVLDWVIRPALRALPGVADVNSLGGFVRTFEVIPDPQALLAQGLTLNQLEAALTASNHNDGAGRLNAGEEALIVRAEGAIQTLDDVRDTVVRSEDGRLTRVADLAEVRIGELTRYGAVTRNGEGEAVQGLVLGLRGANARQLIATVQAKLDSMQASLPKGMTINTFYDRGSLVDRAVYTVSKALLEAVVLVVLLLLAFLGNLRAAIVVALMLPLSALGTFVLMRQFGLSANLMSLGGLAIAIGMLVDGAVVVVENIESHLAHGDAKKMPMLQVVLRAGREVVSPVASGIAIIIIVFLPLLSLQGLEGKLFGPVALTIVFALAISLVLSLTMVPVLASWLLKAGHGEAPWLMRKLDVIYDKLLSKALLHPRWMMGGALAALAVAGVLFTQIGKTFMPTLDEGDIIMQLEKLPAIGLKGTVDLDLRVQQAIMKRVPEVKSIVARSGSDELGLDPMGLNQTDTFMVLKPMAEWRQPDKEWLIGEMRKVMEDFPGVDAGFTQPIDMRVSEMLTGVRGDVAIKIYGNNLATLNEMAAKAEKIIAAVPGATDTLTLRNDGVQYLQVTIDRQAAGRLGLDAASIQADLRRWVEGQPIGLVHEDGRRTPLVIRGASELRNSPADFEALRLTTPNGDAVPLSSVASLDHRDGPVKIDREQAQRYVVIQTNVRGRDLVGFVDEAKAKLAQAMPLPSGYQVTWGGQFENQQRAAQRLGLVVPIALLLIFFLLFSTFGSVRQAAMVLSNIPLALIGGVVGLAVAGEYLSVPASVGFIALLGIAVLNGVVMVSYFNQLIEEGRTPRQAVVEGAKRRLRPVLMTASISAGGLIPLLFATGPGSEIQKPLAIVVIGGLVSSTALTLLLLPLVYERFGVQADTDDTPAQA